MSVKQEQMRQPDRQPADNPRKELLERILSQIREDAQRDPKDYLLDTARPDGEE